MMYSEAAEKLGGRESRKVGNNTYLQRRDENTIALHYHSTDVVMYHDDDTVTLDSGGWQTYTTKDRLNAHTPFRVWAEKGVWYVKGDGWVVPFWDGMRVGTEAPVLPESEQVKSNQDKQTLKLIARYLKGLTPEVWSEVMVKARESTAGDCLYCQLGGDVGKTPDHLMTHLEEGYYMATLALNALDEAGYRMPGVVVDHVDIVKRVLRRFFRAHLLVGNATGRTPGRAIQEAW